jgi:pyruvate,water dikinase
VVARTLEELAAAAAADILVLPSLSASLGTVYARVGGTVAERGGPLSNGTTVVPERGIPAVVLEAAMSRLRTGDRVTIDGAAGTIEFDATR